MRIIEKNKLKVSNQNCTRLSYETVFRDKDFQAISNLTEEDLQNALYENDRTWEVRLNKEVKKQSEIQYQAGYKDGISDSGDVIERHMQPVRTAFEELNEQFSGFMSELKPHITSMIFDLTEKVLEIPINDPDLKSKTESDIKILLKELDDDVKAKILISVDDYNTFGELFRAGGYGKNVTIVADDQMKPGEYKIETDYEMILKDFKKILQDLKESATLSEVAKSDVDSVVHQ